MFNPGDTVVHVNYGAGIFTGTRQVKRKGENVEYCCIRLRRDNSTLMIPAEALDKEMFRSALSMRTVREVLFHEPEALVDHHRSRQSKIESRLKSGDPHALVEVLRDLSWREAIDRLTTTDSRLRDQAHERIARELALNAEGDLEEMKEVIRDILNDAIEHHMTNHSGAAV